MGERQKNLYSFEMDFVCLQLYIRKTHSLTHFQLDDHISIMGRHLHFKSKAYMQACVSRSSIASKLDVRGQRLVKYGCT